MTRKQSNQSLCGMPTALYSFQLNKIIRLRKICFFFFPNIESIVQDIIVTVTDIILLQKKNYNRTDYIKFQYFNSGVNQTNELFMLMNFFFL